MDNEEMRLKKNAEHVKSAEKYGAEKTDSTEIEFVDQYIARSRRKNKKHLTGSVAAKLAALFLSGVAFFTALMGTIIYGNMMIVSGGYRMDLQDILSDRLYSKSRDMVYSVRYYLAVGEVSAAAAVCEKKNIEMELLLFDESGTGKVVWGTWENDYDTQLIEAVPVSFSAYEIKGTMIGGYVLDASQRYVMRVYIDPEFPIKDDFQMIGKLNTWIFEERYVLIGITAGAALLWLVCFLFLMCSAGHRNGRDGLVPGVLTGVYLDVLTAGFGVVAMFFLACIYEAGDIGSEYISIPLRLLFLMILAVWVTLYLMEFSLRVKLGKWWRHSLIYVILCWVLKLMRAIVRGILALIKELPTMMTTLLCFTGICLLEFMGLARYARRFESVFLWGMEKIVLLAIVLYFVLMCKKLLYASRALADGHEDFIVDTSWMFGDFKEHGVNLNNLGRGISKAVAERMKSERLKTELITNVSHDLKTPLTSIINYADLLYEEAAGMPVSGEKGDVDPENKIAEYAEVLLRQSRRLKKLLEDLVDASKATTGNVEVHLEPCEAGVLLIQAVGEYQKKMEDKGLELIARQPEEPVVIMADGRHLWRVFDNLLNNICKYAQENTRVYLSVEGMNEEIAAEGKPVTERNVRIVFRNMSKYPLEVSPEELEERFVRGDKSRHMEGNGLGLSIARSLIDLQGGHMDIVTDGDLFKVTLTFKRI